MKTKHYPAALFAALLIALSGCAFDSGYVRVTSAHRVDQTRTVPALYQQRTATGLGKPVYVRSLDNPKTFIEVGVLDAQD